MHRFALALSVLCIHCGGQTQTAPPLEEPPLPEAPAPVEPTTPPPAETSAPAETSPPVEAPAPEKSAAPQAEKKPCSALAKTTCKVTQGCVWNELKKCVDEGP